MATRSIVTSQPDVACDVCERRLLRGEQPDLFLAAGQPRTVCELCAPRAAHQGWKRGSEQHALGSEPLSSRRGRRLLGRLRQSRRLDERDPPDAYDGAASSVEDRPYDLLGEDPRAGAWKERPSSSRAADDRAGAPDGAGAPVGQHAGPAPAVVDGPLQLAVDVFNAGEYTRRVASLARSLGAPEVTVRAGEAVASCVVIVLAWELCWYAYEVDLDDMQGVHVRAVAQGTELSELGPHDRLANALADERGALALL